MTHDATAALAETGVEPAVFSSLEEAIRTGGPATAIDRLIELLDSQKQYRALLDALLLKARHELSLPLVTSGSLSALPEPERTRYEEKYVDAIRLVGSRHLETGDIPTAWAYYRAIAENEPIAQAIRDYRPTEGDERLGGVIEIAFNHGVSPERGFELILENYGTCPAITAFEQLPPSDEKTRSACAGRLVRHLHRELTANLRSEIDARGDVALPADTKIAAMVQDSPWIFGDEGYHIDVSHLAAVVRMSLLVADRAVMELALDLTEYGRRLSPRLLFDGPPPFEKIFEDHGIYLKGLLGQDVEQAIAHFRGKVTAASEENDDDIMPAQVFVNLLSRIGKLDEAIDVASVHLAGYPESALACPGVSQLCLRAEKPERLAQIAREQGDLVTFTAALLQSQGRENP